MPLSHSRYGEYVEDTLTEGIWRDLRASNQRRAPERDIEITGIGRTIVDGNFPWNLVVVDTDAGVYGIGEAYPGPVGEIIEFLEPALVGQNPLDVDRLTEHMTQVASTISGSLGFVQAAVSGIETALWDLKGKLLDVPAYELLGGKYRDSVPIYADCHAGAEVGDATAADPREIYAPEAYADAARDVLADGFEMLKFDLDVEIERTDTATRRLSPDAIQHKVDVVAAVREAIGDGPLLGCDLHWNFTAETAIQVATRLEPYDLAFLEDPVPPENPEAHRKVTESTTTPILTGENLARVEGFLPFITTQSVDLLSPDIQKAGGLLEFRKIATLADAYDMPIAPHNLASPVGTMGSVHACASVPNVFALEWHAREVAWWDDLHTGDPLIQDGRIQVPEGPGLGIELDPDVVEAHLLPGEEMLDL